MVAIAARWLAAASYAASEYWSSGLGGCNVSHVALPLPSTQTSLVAPTNYSTNWIGLGIGVQNYSCSSSNNYTSVGAVAELFDISCLYGTDLFSTIQKPAYQAWSNTTSNVTVQQFIKYFPSIFAADLILGQHYFVPNPAGSGLSPKWDFTSSGRYKGNSNAFVVGKSIATLPDPYNPHLDVTWVQLSRVVGSLADQVFRIDTVGGQPPASCTYGSSSNISVKYTAQYWFFGGSLQSTSNNNDHGDR